MGYKRSQYKKKVVKKKKRKNGSAARAKRLVKIVKRS